MARTITVLNPGVGGDQMNEVLVEIPAPPTPPPPAPGNVLVKHPIVTIGGEQADDLIQPIDTVPIGTEMALPVRQVGPIEVQVEVGDTLTADQGAPNSDANSWPVHQVGSPPLASGAATSAFQSAGNSSLAAIDASVDVPLSSRASEATVAGILAQLDVALSTRASQATLAAVLAALAPLATEGTLASILGQLDVALSTRASQATVAAILAQLDVALSTRASETTLLAVSAQLDVALSTRASEATLLTRASEATLATRASEATVASILARLDVALSTRASEATLASVLAALGPLATETTLASILGQLDVALSTRASETTVAGILAQLDVALSTRASEATLLAVAASLASIDADVDVALSTRASETTLSAAAVSLASIDTDIDVALSTRASEATLATRASEATLATRASEATVASILAQLDVALSTRASQATVVAILAQLDVALSTRAAAATQTDGTQKSIARGGAKGVTAASDVTSTAEGADHQALDAQLYHGGAAIDPRAIRALTNADVVTAEQGTSPWISQDNANGATGAAVPARAMQLGASDGTNLQAPRVFDVDTGAGTQYALGVSLRKAASGGSVEAGTSTDPLRIDPTGTTSQPVVGAAAQGAAVTGNPVLLAGEDASGNVQRLQTTVLPPGGSEPGMVVRQVVSQTCTTSRTATSTASATILAANTSRIGAMITNESSHDLYVKCGATASATSYTKLIQAGNEWLVPFGYTGIIDAILSSGTGNAQVGEFA